MLKLTYTENGFYLESLSQSLEEWVKTRVLLALRSQTSLWVEPTTAAFLLPADLPYVDELAVVAKSHPEEILEVVLCDEDSIEVVLQGTWLASDPEKEEGVFVCRLSDRAEFFLYKLWQEAQLSASIIE